MDRSTGEYWVPAAWVCGLNPAHPLGVSIRGEEMWTHLARVWHSLVSVWLGLEYKSLLLVSRVTLQACVHRAPGRAMKLSFMFSHRNRWVIWSAYTAL